MQQSYFLKKLEQEAQLQAKIQASAVVPKQLEPLASVVGRHTWKALLLVSGCVALLAEITKT